jgi:hypothetical protein
LCAFKNHDSCCAFGTTSKKQSISWHSTDVETLIKGSGGLRKARWKLEGKGKSGGIRYIYYWISEDDQIIMLYVYRKSKQETLAPEQIRLLKLAIQRWKDEQ